MKLQPLFPWLKALYPVWAGLDLEAVEVSTELALAELMLSGCTLASDRRYLFTDKIAAAIDVQLSVAERLGVRVTLTRGSMSLGESDGGLPPDHVLESLDWLADDVWLAHGIHFDRGEIERLGRAATAISHCASSNMVLASGICPAMDLEDAGSPIGLGVDGSASNDASNMIGEVRQAFLLQRLRSGAEAITHDVALRWATSGGAAVLGRGGLGRLAPGHLADLGCYRLDELRFSGATDPVAALLLCGAHQVSDLMVGGEWRVQGSELVGTDLEALRARHTAASKRISA